MNSLEVSVHEKSAYQVNNTDIGMTREVSARGPVAVLLMLTKRMGRSITHYNNSSAFVFT